MRGVVEDGRGEGKREKTAMFADHVCSSTSRRKSFSDVPLNNAGRETNESGNDRSFAIGVPLISRASVLRETVKAANIKSGSLKYKLAVLRVA